MKRKMKYLSIVFMLFYFTTLLFGNVTGNMKVSAKNNKEKEVIDVKEVNLLKSILDKLFKVGDITVVSVDEEGNELFRKKEKRLKYKTYRLDANEIEGYELVSNNEKIITLDKNNPYSTVVFKYKIDEGIKNNEKLIVEAEEINGSYNIVPMDNYESVVKSDIVNEDNKTNNENKDIEINKESNENEILPAEDTEDKDIVTVKDDIEVRDNDLKFTTVPIAIGEVTVKYIEKNTGNELGKEIISDLVYGEHNFNSKDINGYVVLGESNKSVQLTYKKYKEEIVFEYEKVPEELNENEVPYISTYYVKPIVKPQENVVINYYVTDFYQKEYKAEESDSIFTVKVSVDGKDDIVLKNVMPGDNSINIGSFNEEGEVRFSILATDQHGRNSHELFNFFLVENEKPINQYVMTREDLVKYNIKNTDNYGEIKLVDVDLSSGDSMLKALNNIANGYAVPSKTYIAFVGDSNNDGKRDSKWNETVMKYADDYDSNAVLAEARTTRIGLQNFLTDKKQEGYNAVKLLEGTYRIDHEEAILIPTEFELDMNGAILKQNQFAGAKSLMMNVDTAYKSKVKNGTIVGDYYEHDYVNSTNNSEWVNGIGISGGSTYSSLENMTVKDITGYGVISGLSTMKNEAGYNINFTEFSLGSINNFNLGDINRETGEVVESTTRTTSDFKDISKAIGSGYLSVSRYLGYQGVSGGTWNIICHFYDGQKNYIESIDSYQYRRVAIPDGAKFMKVTILSSETPSDLKVQYFKVPTHCSFKNIYIENARCVGMAQSAMNDFLVEDCTFTQNGQSGAFCAYDAEDGWDMMQDVTFRGMDFYENYRNDFLTCAGQNFMVEDMKRGNVYIWERTNGFVYRNNNSSKGNVTLKTSSRVKGGYYRIYENIINGKVTLEDAGGISNNWPIVVRDCTINGKASNVIGTGKYYNCDIGFAVNGNNHKDELGLGEGEFENSYIHDKSGENKGGIYKNCTMENITGNMHNEFNIRDSEIKNWNANGGAAGSTYRFTSSNLDDFSITMGFWSKGANFQFEDCVITSKDFLVKLPHYSLNYDMNFINNDIKVNGSKGVFWFYDDRINENGGGVLEKQKTLLLENNRLEAVNSKEIVSGLTKDAVNNVNIVSKKNIYNKEKLVICDPNVLSSPRISLVEQ